MGIGNLLMKDEGVGVHVARALGRLPLPPDVEVVDGGTSLDPFFLEVDKLIVVDAARGGGEAGAIYRFRPDDIAPESEAVLSLHQMGLMEGLKMAACAGAVPKDVVIIGVEPKEIDWGLELTPELQGKLPKVIEAVLGEIGEEEREC